MPQVKDRMIIMKEQLQPKDFPSLIGTVDNLAWCGEINPQVSR